MAEWGSGCFRTPLVHQGVTRAREQLKPAADSGNFAVRERRRAAPWRAGVGHMLQERRIAGAALRWREGARP